MTGSVFNFVSHSYDETYLFGEDVGASLFPGAIIALTGELGCGKTSFVKGLASGMGISKNYYITSPTFTLINEYPGRLPLCHVDLYRIFSANDLYEIGLDEIFDKGCVVAIEWADKMNEKYLPKNFTVHFEFVDDNSRQISITPYGDEAVRLLKNIKNIDFHINKFT